ncbi:putative Ig domain-containing protein [Oscillatoria sp. HE19RPO]|uniref:putative Ig domain-containing protein n=1 Tax=Oscillatoria sp. HE19RPO TaxID=2954806 RepID=UPI0020C43DC1|nr:putative Ig domain-containing protein [Oscillatoria sp. HE19RPO]
MAIAFQGAYIQDFNSLANNGTNHAWTNDFTLPGWYLFRQPEPGSEVFTYDANHGGSNKGSFYSYGVTDDSDRALGGLGSGGAYFGGPATGTIAGWIAFAATNTTGLPINSITLDFDGEQWRRGANATPQTMVLEYGLGETFDTVQTWNNPGGNFDFTSPLASATGGAVNGNMEGSLANQGGTIHDLTWENNQTLWIRWVTLNDEGHDHGLAIDNFSLAWYNAIITESDGSTNVTEGGATDTYTIVLTNRPTAEVTITINPDHHTTTGVDSVIFTPENWDEPQAVEIVAVDDNLVEGNQIGTITHTATSTDPNYNGISIDPVTANITDNDSANNPPVVVNAIADLTATVSTLFNFTLPADTFKDPDGNPLSYSATLDDGSELPPWLIFNATTRTFIGTPLENNIGNINIKVTASDGSLSVSDIVTLEVSPVTPNPEFEEEDSPESEANNPDSEANNPPELPENSPESETNPPELSENSPESETNPPELSENSPESETNPPELSENSPESETNPPELSENSPKSETESETNPPELSETHPELETESETNPPKLLETPPELETESETNPPELLETPPESETNPPELLETPPESETNPLEWVENSLEITEIGFIQLQGFGPIGPSYFKALLANEEISDSPLSSSHFIQLEFHEAEKSSNNTLIETSDSDLIQAIAGDNFIQELGGNDSLFGGEGHDIIQGNPGDDFIKAGNGTNWIHGGEGEDTLVGGTGVDILYGNEGNDLIYAGSGDNFLYGNQGNDTLIGGEGNDVLYGGKGDDLLIGGNEEDWLFGDLGNDILMGGEGPDRFIIRKDAGVDLIVDFTEGEDLIGLSQGLTFNDLTFNQGNNGLLIYAGDELLAILNEMDISVINPDNFFEVG